MLFPPHFWLFMCPAQLSHISWNSVYLAERTFKFFFVSDLFPEYFSWSWVVPVCHLKKYCSWQIYIQKRNNPAAPSNKVMIIPHSFELATYAFLKTYSYELAAALSLILFFQLKFKSLINRFYLQKKDKMDNFPFEIDGSSKCSLPFLKE